MPKHKNPTRTDRTALAPYNFVPVAEPPLAFPDQPNSALNVDQSHYHGNRFTGWIDVAVETKSPVYVRGPLTPDEYDLMEQQDKNDNDKTPHLQKVRNRPTFFYTDPQTKEPVIPGSSLRGMLRTLAQILSYGKLNPVSSDPLIYRAVADMSSHGTAYRQLLMEEQPGEKNYFTPRFEAGYMEQDEDGNWSIRPAQRIQGVSHGRIHHSRIPKNRARWHECKNAYELYAQLSELKFQRVRDGFVHIKRILATDASATDNGWQKIILAESGQINKKASEAFAFPPDQEATLIRIPDGTVEGEPDLLAAYRNQISPDQEKLLDKNGVLRPHQPVFYVMERGKLVFFGHTQMFRLPYRQSPQEMLHPFNNDSGRLDLAEAIFGRARGKSGGQAGRVFVSDARLDPDQDRNKLWLEGEPVVIPQILSGPKATTFQHYLTQDKPDVDKGQGLRTYNDSRQQTTLRGFKMYWHKGDATRPQFAESAPIKPDDKQHTQIQPVRTGVQFHFRLYFENLSQAELGLLWWALALPTGDNQTRYHKIGMAKPLGLGAIQLTPTLHVINPATRYQSLLASEGWVSGEESQAVSEQLIKEAVKTFEGLILRLTKAAENRFRDLERVNMLLKLLEWPGPDPANTRYMEIEHIDRREKKGKRNEYRERPVLPNPLATK